MHTICEEIRKAENGYIVVLKKYLSRTEVVCVTWLDVLKVLSREAGEELPLHKDAPKMGGDYPLVLTSGHPRTSIHSANIMNRMIQDTHQGRPHMFMSTEDAAARNVRDGDLVRAFNDKGSFQLWAKLSPSVRPGQVIVYNGFEPLMFPGWKDPANAEPGMAKWLSLAGGYGHLRFRSQCWQPTTADRLVRLEVERVT